jgi:hypothetical protein
MRYEIAIALLAATLFGAGWVLRRNRPAREPAGVALQPAAGAPIGAIRRRPF